MVTEEKNALAGVVRGAGALLATAGVALSLAACGGQPASAPATDQAAATTSSSTAAAGTPMTVIQAEGTPAPVIEVSDEDLENHTVTSESGTTYVDNQLVITYGPSQADDLESFKQVRASNDADQIKSAMESFSKATMDVFAKVYQQANPGAGDPGAGTGYTYQGGQGSNVNDDGTVDSEFTDGNN